ncbi:Metallo-dependent phosphatase-like protein [Pavlovales sp. CCMP2436]|nr:Metallo-dependent phosphatase-like protein [Pavlovales sp. CCMP2436]
MRNSADVARALAATERGGEEDGPSAGFARRAIVGDLPGGDLGSPAGPLRQVSVDRMGDAESRLERRDPAFRRRDSVHTAIAAQVISVLLRPAHWKPPPPDQPFEFSPHELVELCEYAEAVLRDEPTLLELSAPIKIFGDIHGQYPDLMRLFAEFGTPSHTGDLDLVDYLFLGDYVDRGAYQLETICLVLALKIEYPSKVFLLRGNHESPEINEKYGFRDECLDRLGTAGDAVWRCFNAVFAWMPLAATISKKIFCVHGGLGLTVESLAQVAAIQRPIQRAEGPLLMDLLWSDPQPHDSLSGITLNAQRLGVDRTPDRPPEPGECTTFDAARVNDFCRNNGIQLIIRAHECVMDGFEKFASGRLVTVFSASRYCNTYENAGAILLVDRSLTVIPKLLRPTAATAYGWLEHDNYQERPPTPPRGRQSAPIGGGGVSAAVGEPMHLKTMPREGEGEGEESGPLDSMRGVARGLPAVQSRRADSQDRTSRSPTR